MQLIRTLRAMYDAPHTGQREQNYRTSEQVFLAGLALASAWFIGAYFYIAWNTLNWSFFIDWSEGNLFLPVLRIRSGLPVYSPPMLDYIPNLYTPLFYYAAAA